MTSTAMRTIQGFEITIYWSLIRHSRRHGCKHISESRYCCNHCDFSSKTIVIDDFWRWIMIRFQFWFQSPIEVTSHIALFTWQNELKTMQNWQQQFCTILSSLKSCAYWKKQACKLIWPLLWMYYIKSILFLDTVMIHRFIPF